MMGEHEDPASTDDVVPNEDAPVWAKSIYELRKAAGQTQAKAAYACGTDSTNWSRWERGVTTPRANNIVAIAKHFGVSTDRVLLGDQSQPFVETPEWLDFLASPYGKIAADRGLLDVLKRARIHQKMTKSVYETLVHMMLADRK